MCPLTVVQKSGERFKTLARNVVVENSQPTGMLYRLAADLVLLSHFLFAAFAVFGGFLAFYNPAWAWVHIPVVLWSSVVNLMSWTCPLTPH